MSKHPENHKHTAVTVAVKKQGVFMPLKRTVERTLRK